MPAEDEAMTMILRVGDTVVQSAEQVLLMLLRACADAQRRTSEHRAATGQDGVLRRVAKAPANAMAGMVAGVGDRGIVSQKLANPDGKSLSYAIEAGVLTRGDLKRLNREFAVRQLQVGVIDDTKPSAGEFFDDSRVCDRVEFTVKRDQVEQFEAALSRIVPQAGAREDASKAEGETLDCAKVLDGRDDLRMMCKSLNDAGASVAFSRDAEGCVEIGVKGGPGIDGLAESLRMAAQAYGLADAEVAMKPIREGGQGAYPDSFEYCGLAFARTGPGAQAWVARDPDDPRVEVSVSVEDGKPAYAVSRNGAAIAVSASDREFFFAHDQPVESGCLAAASALDRIKRPEERAAAEKVAAMRGKALSASGGKRAGSASSETAKRGEEAKRVSRKLSGKAPDAGRGEKQGGPRR